MRKEFELTEKQYNRLLDACKPVPYMVFNGRTSASPQENANAMWRALGDELGFEYMSVRPVPGKNQHFFTAEIKD